MPADVAVLIVAFNRPDKTRRVLEAVRAAAPRRLYLAADGPRAHVPSDAELCAATRRVLEQIPWPCEVRRLYRPTNLGCKRGVAGAIDWLLTHEESGIILEDDCLPGPDFFPFCAELLDRYRDDSDVMMIGGFNDFGSWDAAGDSYLFTHTAPIWGWATWRSAWDRYDPAMRAWADSEARAVVRSRTSAAEYRLFGGKFDGVYEGRIDSWGFAWTLAILVSGGLSVMPADNLVTNIGFDGEATHTRWRREGEVPTRRMPWPLRHPTSTTPDEAFERALFRKRFAVGRRLVAALPPPAQERVRAAVYRLAAAVRPAAP
ncbi:hemolytic protein HlpA [Actinomycetospora chlora]|uniref:Hemolytic protein HlpA n=1 Tax=Actinomycetospora chlora TaxID=663608 RepID=A0ABP9A310_9PSEU